MFEGTNWGRGKSKEVVNESQYARNTAYRFDLDKVSL